MYKAKQWPTRWGLENKQDQPKQKADGSPAGYLRQTGGRLTYALAIREKNVPLVVALVLQFTALDATCSTLGVVFAAYRVRQTELIASLPTLVASLPKSLPKSASTPLLETPQCGRAFLRVDRSLTHFSSGRTGQSHCC